MVSVDFNEIVDAIYTNDWSTAARILINAACKLEHSGADFMALCCNTLYKVATDIKKEIHIPLLHILDPTAKAIQKKSINKVGLFGTCFTMEEIFHKEYLKSNFNIEVLIPTEQEREIINKIIFDELCHRIIKPQSRQKLIQIANSLTKKGVQGIILGCTELPLLFSQEHLTIPLFSTTILHAKELAYLALRDPLTH